jgi:TatD DNase family protein
LSYVDAHLHLADPAYAGRIEQAIEDATTNNVAYLLSNAVDYSTSLQTITLAKNYPRRVLAAIGVHPSVVTETADYQLNKFEELIEKNGEYVKAVGEIGLDGKYAQDEAVKNSQREVFQFFLRLAERKQLPVVVHSRLAVDEVLECLSGFRLQKVLLHWYDGPAEKLSVTADHGYLISLSPALLYSRRLSEIARKADLGMVLTETDGPVTYRGPFKGRPTQPSFVVDVVRELAEIKSVNVDEMREAVYENFREFIRDLS